MLSYSCLLYPPLPNSNMKHIRPKLVCLKIAYERTVVEGQDFPREIKQKPHIQHWFFFVLIWQFLFDAEMISCQHWLALMCQRKKKKKAYLLSFSNFFFPFFSSWSPRQRSESAAVGSQRHKTSVKANSGLIFTTVCLGDCKSV